MHRPLRDVAELSLSYGFAFPRTPSVLRSPPGPAAKLLVPRRRSRYLRCLLGAPGTGLKSFFSGDGDGPIAAISPLIAVSAIADSAFRVSQQDARKLVPAPP